MAIEPKHYEAELTEGTRVWVRMDNGMRFDARIVNYDSANDCLVVRIPTCGENLYIDMTAVKAIGRKLNQ
ncbi:MAG: hypothetical protein AB7C95_00665 [Synergistaceae bacterium]